MASIIIHPAAAMRRGETLDEIRWTAEQRRVAILQLSDQLEAERERRLAAEQAARRYALLAFAAGWCTLVLGAAVVWLLGCYLASSLLSGCSTEAGLRCTTTGNTTTTTGNGSPPRPSRSAGSGH